MTQSPNGSEIMKRLLFILCVLVLAACGGDDATDTADDTSPATTPTTIAAPTTTVAAIEETTTTTEVVETTTTTEVAVMSDAQAATIAAYETSWNDGEWDAFRALFAPSASLEDSMFGVLGDVDQIVTWSTYRLAMGVEFSIDDCAPSGETVVCAAEFDGVVPIAMNSVPWRDRYVFSFEDGLIAHIKVTCVICWDGNADDRLRAWVKTVDNSVVVQFGYNLVLTEEKAAAWLEWAPKWQEAGRP
jgi:hypothetical protein